jgi:uncharacterized protein YbaR (Trm112 family)
VARGQHRAVALPPELLEILVCPTSRAPLVYFAGGEAGDRPEQAFLYCPASGLRYRIDDDVPVLLIDEAVRVTPAEAARLDARARELGLLAR